LLKAQASLIAFSDFYVVSLKYRQKTLLLLTNCLIFTEYDNCWVWYRAERRPRLKIKWSNYFY